MASGDAVGVGGTPTVGEIVDDTARFNESFA